MADKKKIGIVGGAAAALVVAGGMLFTQHEKPKPKPPAAPVLQQAGINLPSFTCSNGVLNSTNPTKGVLVQCKFQHQEYLPAGPVTLTRIFGVYLPRNFVPGQSGLITKIQGTTHKITGDCKTVPAVSEAAGWLIFLESMNAPAPGMLCTEGLFDTGGADNGERFNAWGFGNKWNWAAIKGSNGQTYSSNSQIKPNDEDFVTTVNAMVQNALNTDRKFNPITNDWIATGAALAYQVGSKHPDQFSSIVLYNDIFGGPFWTKNADGTYTDNQGQHITFPAAPQNILIIASKLGAGTALCGNTLKGRPFTTDDTIAFFNTVLKPDVFFFLDPKGSNKKFCNHVNNGTAGAYTTLERYVASSSVNKKTMEAWYFDPNARGTPVCSFGYNEATYPGLCDPLNPPVDWRHPPANYTSLHPGNVAANNSLGISLLEIEMKFMERTRLP